MKKTLLGLSLLPLVVLPVTTMASCSVKKVPEVASLETEVKKFQTPVAARYKEITATMAAGKIISTEPTEQKLAALNKIATTVPRLDDGFVMIVNSAVVSETNLNSIEVSITISETSNEAKKDVVFTITDFKPILDWVSGLFVTTEVKKKDQTADKAITTINTQTTQEEKIKTLKTYVDLPSDFILVEARFNIIIGSVATNGFTSIIVPITFSEKATPSINKKIAWIIAGFPTAFDFN